MTFLTIWLDQTSGEDLPVIEMLPHQMWTTALDSGAVAAHICLVEKERKKEKNNREREEKVSRN